MLKVGLRDKEGLSCGQQIVITIPGSQAVMGVMARD